VENSEII